MDSAGPATPPVNADRVSRPLNGADRLARRLAAAGIRHAFGIPGGEVLAFVEAVRAAGIEPVLVKHENSAGFMAEGTWHATNAPGLFYATLGPGVANAINVVANAFQDRVPLIFVTGCVDQAEAESYTHQIFDHQALLRPIVKASLRATAETCELVAIKALAIALAGRPGPVHIDLPISVAEGIANERTHVPTPRMAPQGPAASAELEAARAALKVAKRPLVISGLDVVNQGAADAVARLAGILDAPVVTTYKAKGIIDETSLHVLGGAGLSPKADRLLLPLIQTADVIVLAGYDPIEMRIGWRHPFASTTVLIDVVAEAMTHGMHDSTHLFVGDVAASLDMLSVDLKQKNSWPEAEPVQTRAALQAAFTAEPVWGPARAFTTLRDIAPRDTVVTVDSGAHRILASQIWPCFSPRTMLQSTALCTMGCAVPLAFGYKLAKRDTPVLAFVGDAGLEMVLGELATARDRSLGVVIAVFVDESLALIEMKQRSTQRPNAAVDFGASDFPAIAKALGGYGVWIDDTETLKREAKLAFSRSGAFSLLAIRIGKRAYEGKF